MKRSSLALAGLITTLTIGPACADDFMPAKQGATFVGATAAGAALGGPIGMLVGALGGVWYAEKIEDAAQFEATHEELQVSRQELVEVQHELVQARQTNEQYATLVMEQLQLEMLFRTGASELSDAGKQRLASLAGFLVDNPLINIQLDGYADPRGGQDYNLELSQRRVAHVASVLLTAGVDQQRIATHSYGASHTAATEGDYDGYAMERVVKIQLSPESGRGLAQAN